MSSYRSCLAMEAKGRRILEDFLAMRCGGRFVVTDKGPMSYELQKTAGDALANDSKGEVYGIEFKIEQQDCCGNLFLETWSNRQFDRRNPGWMLTLTTDYLWYYFFDSDDLYWIDFRKLWDWSFVQGNIYRYPERTQSKNRQLNVTAGRTVPIEEIEKSGALKSHCKPAALLPVPAQ